MVANGRGDRLTSLSGRSTGLSGLRRCRLGGQVATVVGGPQMRVNSRVQAVSQGQWVGRCTVMRLAEEAARAATLTSFRRTVAVVALDRSSPASVAAARVRLNVITASTNQAEFAANELEGRWARAELLRSAWTCSMIAWPRWVLSAVTVSITAGSVVVKKAWNRQVSNKVAWPSAALGLRSGIRRTTNRPGTWSAFFLEVTAVNSISATSAFETQRSVCSS